MVSLHRVLGFGLDLGGWPLHLDLGVGILQHLDRGHSPIPQGAGTEMVLKNGIEFGKTRYNEN